MTVTVRTAIAGLLWVMAGFSPAIGAEQSCVASIYGNGDGYAWQRTASGIRMDPTAHIAAMRPPWRLGRYVVVTHHGSGRSVRVKVVDRGPYVAGRCIDLSPAAARDLGCDGLCRVTVRSESPLDVFGGFFQ